jgi:Flp pilus assembly protein TadG
MIVRQPSATRQQGAAAVEFALALPIFMLLLWGLLSFASVFYTQLAVSRAAHDGARAAVLLPPSAGLADAVRAAVIDSLAATPVAAIGQNGSYASRRTWLASNVSQAIVVTSEGCDGSTCVTVRVNYPYGDGVRLLPSISLPGLGMISFIPDILVAEAVVVR